MVLAGAAATVSCDVFEGKEPSRRVFFREDFAGSGDRWSEPWLNVRYAGHCERRRGKGLVRVGPAPSRAVDEAARQTEYMAQPRVVATAEVSDIELSVSVSVEGFAEAGVIARWDHDRAYALLVGEREILLVRYDTPDRSVLERTNLPDEPRPWRLTLAVEKDRIRGRVEGGGKTLVLSANDQEPLGRGVPGVLVNPTDSEKGGVARFTSFRAASKEEPAAPRPRFVYRFAGGVVSGEARTRARLTARTVYPQPVGFEIARDEGFSEPVVLDPREPEGKWGSVHAWAEGLEEGDEYFWRPFVPAGAERVVGRAARFRAPASGRAVRFAFASCTSGRSTEYKSFSTAASFDPEFFLHAGDWG
ncbi:MAG: hypothetical protein ACRDKZ_09620, partial [Actinomycetota bacterium]